MNFNSFFNQWRTQPASGLADLIDTPGITLARLLDQEQFSIDYKSGNAKVAEYMKYEKYEQLLQFVTVVGPADDKKRSYKYPMTACELLSIENTNANSTELFLPDRSILVQNKIIENVEEEIQVEVEQPTKIEPEDSKQKPQMVQDGSAVGQIEELEASKQAETKVQAQPKEGEQAKQEPKAATNEQQKQKSETATVKPVEKTKTKIIQKVTKQVQKIVQVEKPALIVKLLSYFSGEVNYTLAGYVSKILGFLLTKKPAEFFKYVLQEKMMHQILNHAESRSVGELIVKVLTHESIHSLDLRQNFYKQLLARLSVPSEIYVISNLSAYVCEIIQKVAINLKSNNKIIQLSNLFFSLQITTQIIKNVMSEEESVSVYNAPILLTYLTNVPFTLPEDQTIIEEFKQLGQLFVEKSCEKLQVEYRSRPKLGGGRIKLLEILRYVLKENLLNSKQTVAASKQFFPILLKLMRQYQMNNILHNEIIKILEIALSQPENSNLNNSVLSQNVLLDFIRSETEQDKKIRAKDSVYKSRKGYIAHVINLSVRLRELSEKNSKIKEITQSSDFSSVYDGFIEKQNVKTRKSLAGFTKKDSKHEIMFQKEDILANYITFFQKCPSAVFQPEPKPEQPVNIQHPDLVQELQKQLQQNLTLKQVTAQTSPNNIKHINNEQIAAQKQVQAEQIAQGQFWSAHLQYDIDELINDL